MNNRDWFSLALRLFGIGLLLQGAESIAGQLLFTISVMGTGQNSSYVVFMLMWFIGRTATGLVLLLFAPAISTRFYPKAVSSESTPQSDEVKPLKVGIQLLGVYALLLAVQSGAGVIVGILTRDRWNLALSTSFSGAETGYLGSLLACGLNLAFAAILIAWNEQVVTLLAKFRYVSERDAYGPPSLNE